MEDFVFSDEPTEKNLKQVLGKTYRYLIAVDRIASGFEKEWKNYGRNYGWTYKISAKRKTLCWIGPKQGFFTVGMTLRERERDDLHTRRLSPCMAERIRTAKEYSEGFAIRVDVRTKTDCDEISRLLRMVILMRKKSETCKSAQPVSAEPHETATALARK